MSIDRVDSPEEIRSGDELDALKVREYIRKNVPGTDGDFVIKQYPRGYSNLTYLIRAGDKEIILRKPPAGKKAKSAHDMGREYRVLKALKPVYPYCPTPILYCDDTSVTGSPFFLMERLQGIIMRKNLPPGLTMTPGQAEKLCRNMVRLWGELHSIDYRGIGLGDFGKPAGYRKRQVDGWSSRYREARTDDAPSFEKVIEWLGSNIPAGKEKDALIHNDFKFDNLVLDPEDPTRIIGVLDWEMATIGDPLMDLGSGLAYWVNRGDPQNMEIVRTLPTTIEGALTREEMASLYRDVTGTETEPFHFYYCFGLFRLAVIAQQIYYRYYHGQTKDERFKLLIFAVKILEEQSLRALKGG